ncbi:hypothetical protein DM01DRAFT_319535 [Hesseltinella vesiculosa]|uniref:Abscisic acid G-protein coupled receptor-like domain-containing protein n=1 Tax=Hesseltinella vesiculosa TaxID=101127 RepID=A0A1X2GV07_9FUNG|nr:hypothetical protein DM01DRAFT_319535 [Hesseltinella vesiculosa]
MKSDLDELERYWLFHRHSKTFRGKCRTLLDIGISVYCVYKLCMTAWNVLVGRMGNGDPVTNLLSWMMARAGNNVHMDPNFWSQQLSFWFAGIIVSRTMRGFFQLVTKIIGHFLSTMAIDDSQILLMMANLMGMYFLSSVVMMQLSLPVDYRYLLASSLEHVEFTFFQHWADLIVFIASVCTIVVLYAVKQTKDISGLAKDYADINLDALESGP